MLKQFIQILRPQTAGVGIEFALPIPLVNETKMVKHEPPASPLPATAAVVVPANPQPTDAGQWVAVSFAQIIEHWPEALRLAWNDQPVAGVRVALPFDRLQSDLRQGRITRSWTEFLAAADHLLTLPPQVTGISATAEIPLAAAVPAFLAAAGLLGKAVSAPLPEEVPDLFFYEETAVPPVAATAPSAVGPKPAKKSKTPVPETVLAPPPLTVLAVPFASLLAYCPASLQTALAAADLHQLQVQFPVARIESQLQHKRLEFSWREFVGWLKPVPPPLPDLPDATRIEIPPASLSRAYLRWQMAAKAAATSPPPQPPTAAPPQQSDARASQTIGETKSSGHSAVATADELAARLFRTPGVETVLVMDERGQLMARRPPTGRDCTAIAAALPKLHEQVRAALKTQAGNAAPPPMLLACGPWLLVVFSLKKQWVVAVAQTQDQPPVELWRLIRTAENNRP